MPVGPASPREALPSRLGWTSAGDGTVRTPHVPGTARRLQTQLGAINKTFIQTSNCSTGHNSDLKKKEKKQEKYFQHFTSSYKFCGFVYIHPLSMESPGFEILAKLDQHGRFSCQRSRSWLCFLKYKTGLSVPGAASLTNYSRSPRAGVRGGFAKSHQKKGRPQRHKGAPHRRAERATPPAHLPRIQCVQRQHQ